MTTTHGYAPGSQHTTLCNEPVGYLADVREKITSDASEINCVRCLTSPLYQSSKRPAVQTDEATKRTKLDDLLSKTRRLALEWGEQEGCGAQVIDDVCDAMITYDGGVPPTSYPYARPRADRDHFTLPEPHTRALLQAVLAWRRQGAASRWSTVPSRALVTLTDRIKDAFPALCEELLPTVPDSVCGYVDCDSEAEVTLADGARMCRHHAIVNLATGMTRDAVQAALRDADRDTIGEMARLAKLAEEERDGG